MTCRSSSASARSIHGPRAHARIVSMGRKARRKPAPRRSPERQRELEERACKKKTRYRTAQEALAAQQYVRLAYDNDKGIYECDFCGGWHLGGRPVVL